MDTRITRPVSPILFCISTTVLFAAQTASTQPSGCPFPTHGPSGIVSVGPSIRQESRGEVSGSNSSAILVASTLPVPVRAALEILGLVRPEHVVVLESLAELRPYLYARGYHPDAVQATLEDVVHFAEFTIDHHFPIFINASSPHYRRIISSWNYGTNPTQAVRVLASDIYHEYRHAACGDDEITALDAHVALLKHWRTQGLLTIADPYIVSKNAELHMLRWRLTTPLGLR